MMKFITTLAFFILSFTSYAFSRTSPSGNTTCRHLPGPVSNVTQALLKDNSGFVSVGDDGVVRSFVPNGTVIDYYQLDPDQVKQFAEKQYSAWAAHGEGDVPASVSELARPPYPDGCLVVNETQLLFPSVIPDTGDQSVSPSATSADKPTRALGLLSSNNPTCVGWSCQSLADCQPHCLACYFQHGPPNGICFAD
ncbi:hypothetical protein F5B22DRAFT_108523 [Xylaria bambusicola]|uniref:uncharacterized protein n=1 Tax=Xylaria bambusicola TaxID=326684 RepID=UPI0020075BD2|nr:uncharacterized protein F5B22DRAFT_108523 [Xylaria bambusicola]KAI0517520.1 hypothetical protein F5B22DRAFT_108523 [Xylaria bambusicola]